MRNVLETENNTWPKKLKGKYLTTDLRNISTSPRAAAAWHDMLPPITGTPWASPLERSHAGSSRCLGAVPTRWTRSAELGVNSKHLAQALGVTSGSPASTAPLLLPCFTPSASPSHPQHHLHPCSAVAHAWETLPTQQLQAELGTQKLPEPSETRDSQLRSLVPHSVPKRRSSW